MKGKVAGGLGVLLIFWSGAIAEATSQLSIGRACGAVPFLAGIWLLGRTGAFTRSARNGVSRNQESNDPTNMSRTQGGP